MTDFNLERAFIFTNKTKYTELSGLRIEATKSIVHSAKKCLKIDKSSTICCGNENINSHTANH
jgi:hypothetical protein